MTIRFQETLHRPVTPKGASWTFLVLPKSASEQLPTRATTTVDGSLCGASFTAALSPDGKGSHWLKVPARLASIAGVAAGDTVTVEMRSANRELESEVPTDLLQALEQSPEAMATWGDITTVMRRDWISWITTAKREATRERRVASACDQLASGKRSVCCFDRTGMYGGGFAAPEAARQLKDR